MLESIGYAESDSRDEADLILFNTCSIRESADTRLVGHLGEAKRLKAEDPSRVVGIGGCWSQSMKERVFEQFPFVDVAFGPGQVHRLAEFLTSDSLTAQGYFEFEGFTGPPADASRARVSGLGADLGRLQLRVLVLHRALHARARGVAAGRGARGRGRAPGGRRRARGHAARPERELLRPRPAARGQGHVRGAAGDGRRGGGHRPHPLHQPAPQGHARGRDRGPRAAAERCASTSTCRFSRAPAGSSRPCGAPTTARATMDRVAQIRAAVPDCAITTDIIVGFPGETDADFERDAWRWSRRCATTPPSPSSSRPGAAPRPPSCPTRCPHAVKRERMERLVRGGAADRRRALAAVRGPHDGGAGRRGPSRTDPAKAARAHPSQQDGATSPASPSRASWWRSRSARPPAPRSRARSGCSPALPDRAPAVLALFGPTGVGKTAVALALADLLRARGEDPVAISADALQVYRGPGDAHRRRDAAASRSASSTAWWAFVPVTEPFSVGRLHAARARRDRRRAGGRTDADRGGRHRPVPAGGAGGPLAREGRPRGRSRSCGRADTRHPTLLVGLTMEREALYERIDARVDAIVAAGAADEVRRARAAGASRTARKALGFDELPDGRRRRAEAAQPQLRQAPAHLDAQARAAAAGPRGHRRDRPRRRRRGGRRRSPARARQRLA